MVLTEPVVEPIQPPCKDKKVKNIPVQTPQLKKSADENPVVVMTEIMLNELLRKAVKNDTLFFKVSHNATKTTKNSMVFKNCLACPNLNGSTSRLRNKIM